jgi:predicted RNA-binding protein YlqC (UPF0109 family)
MDLPAVSSRDRYLGAWRTVPTMRLQGGHLRYGQLFLEAEREVGEVIQRAVALSDGDPRQALGELHAWASAGGPERRLTLFHATRYRLQDDLPRLFGTVDRLFEEHREDLEKTGAAFAETQGRARKFRTERPTRHGDRRRGRGRDRLVGCDRVPRVASGARVTPTDLCDWLKLVVAPILTRPADFTAVAVYQSNAKVIVQMSVATDDRGRIIGKSGATINGLKTVTAAVGGLHGFFVALELQEETERR